MLRLLPEFLLLKSSDREVKMKNFDEFTDEELLERINHHDGKVEEYLLNKYKPLVRKKARAMYLAGGDTDDLIQEGMLGLFKAVRDFRPGKAASFFLHLPRSALSVSCTTPFKALKGRSISH